MPLSLLLGRLLPPTYRAKIFLAFRLSTQALALLVLIIDIWPATRNTHLAIQIQMKEIDHAYTPLLLNSDEEDDKLDDYLNRFATL